MDTPAPQSPPPIPEKIGPYLIDRKIGSGGMGTVYLAKHEETGREAAVKVLPASLSREEGFIARFQREIDALRKLKNANVVEFFEGGEDNETYYYAMEYIDGVTLTEEIQKTGRIEWRKAIGIAVQICSALKAAHDAGTIHRDLKPSNLIIRKDGVVKLADFGVAKVFAPDHRLTRTGGVIGTVEYMSPEQAKGGRVTPRSDLYSLGAVLYAMLTGRPPFLGKSSLEIVQKHQYGQFDKPILFAPDMPHWLDDLVCQLLEKDPEKRPPSAYVLSRRLQEIVKKVDLSIQDETIAVVERQESSLEATVASETYVIGPAKPGIGTIMRDAVRRELTTESEPGPLGRFFNNTWFLVAMLVLLILGGVWWFRSRQISPQQHFDAGVALMQSASGDDWITARDKHFQPLLDADADRWRKKAEPHLQKIRLYELERRFRSGGRSGKLRRPQSEPERFLLAAIQLRDSGQLDRAEQWLVALQSLTDDDESHRDVHRLAKRLLTEIRKERKELQQDSALLKSAFAQANRHLKNGQRKKAVAVWRAVETLYGNNPSANSDVERARKLIRQHSQQSSTGKRK